jgi:hypothetical protein
MKGACSEGGRKSSGERRDRERVQQAEEEDKAVQLLLPDI